MLKLKIHILETNWREYYCFQHNNVTICRVPVIFMSLISLHAVLSIHFVIVMKLVILSIQQINAKNVIKIVEHVPHQKPYALHALKTFLST